MLELEDAAIATASWRGPARLQLIDEVRAGVVAFADARGMTETTRRGLGMAVHEAVGNAVRQAHPGQTPGLVEIDVAADDRCLTVRVSDEGPGATGERAGLGVMIMRGLSERFEIGPASDGSGTVVVMEFPMAGRTAL